MLFKYRTGLQRRRCLECSPGAAAPRGTWSRRGRGRQRGSLRGGRSAAHGCPRPRRWELGWGSPHPTAAAAAPPPRAPWGLTCRRCARLPTACHAAPPPPLLGPGWWTGAETFVRGWGAPTRRWRNPLEERAWGIPPLQTTRALCSPRPSTLPSLSSGRNPLHASSRTRPREGEGLTPGLTLSCPSRGHGNGASTGQGAGLAGSAGS